MLWVFTGIVMLMVMLAMSTDQVQVGGAIGNTFRNAPFVVEQFYSIFWFITLLMVTAFANSAAAREFAYNMHQIVFTKPIRKIGFPGGQVPGLGRHLHDSDAGHIARRLAGQVDALGRCRPVRPGGGLGSLAGHLVFALPNTLFIAAIMFTIAALTRSTVVSFLGGLLLLVADIVAGVLTEKLENEKLAAIVDPVRQRRLRVDDEILDRRR